MLKFCMALALGSCSTLAAAQMAQQPVNQQNNQHYQQQLQQQRNAHQAEMNRQGHMNSGGGGNSSDGFQPPGFQEYLNAPKKKESTWGAIALAKDGSVLGIAKGNLTEGGAEVAAEHDCQRLGGKNCETMITFLGACGAVANGDKRSWYGVGRSLRDAEASSIANCQKAEGNNAKCEIVHSLCTLR